jgi:2,3-bisphosphoglycerate-independent phosphoglycerate mutase
MLWLNFREDRARQTLGALCNKDFNEFKVPNLANLKVASLLPIDEVDDLINLIDKDETEYSISKYLSLLGKKQARITEEDKSSNLTYYFNGCNDKRIKGLDNYIIPSYPRNETINHPEMNIEGITKQAIKCIEHDYDFIVVNIEAPDIFGHIGDINKAIESLKIVDNAIEEICEACDDNFYKLIITSDHGNIEEMINDDGTPNKGHTNNPVPFIIRDKNVSLKSKGSITQVAGTILKYMDIAIPKEMKEAGILFKED